MAQMSNRWQYRSKFWSDFLCVMNARYLVERAFWIPLFSLVCIIMHCSPYYNNYALLLIPKQRYLCIQGNVHCLILSWNVMGNISQKVFGSTTANSVQENDALNVWILIIGTLWFTLNVQSSFLWIFNL
jgi:hypothetical protein